jgi:ribosome-binding factor A
MTRQQKPGGSSNRSGSGKHGKRTAAPRGPSQRQLRVGEEMRHALSRIIARDDLSDPDLVHRQVTVTAVDVSPDLRNAIAYVVPFGVAVEGDADTNTLIKALNRASAFFRGQLSREVDLRMAPLLRFRLDESFGEANRIEALLHDPLVARDLGPKSDDSEPDQSADDESDRAESDRAKNDVGGGDDGAA